MTSDFRAVASKSIADAHRINHDLVEKAFAMRCTSYLAQIKAQLLTDTIFEIDQSKKHLYRINRRLKREIDERAEAERALREAKEEAEQANLLKDKFVALVTHDLRNALTSVVGYLQLAERRAESGSGEGQAIGQGLAACRQMGNLIDDILSLNRIQSGMLRPRAEHIKARQVADAVMSVHAGAAGEKGIRLRNDIPDDYEVYADEHLLREVIGNLVSNAVKFSNPGDAVTMNVPPGQANTIVVADSGVGIDAHRVDSLFHYETLISTPGTGGERGTGYGLPLANDIVRAHGGQLDVESELGTGTTFTIHLPAQSNP